MTRAQEAEDIPDIRRANKAEAALFFGITLPVLDRWVREGMPIAQRGARNLPWVLDLRDIAEWRFTPRRPSGEIDPETLPPGERKLWYDGETRRRELQVRDKHLLLATDVEETVGTAFSSVAQTLLALSDNLERRAGLSPGQAESADMVIHETLSDLADRLGPLAPVGVP